jgi:hypothetical protein
MNVPIEYPTKPAKPSNPRLSAIGVAVTRISGNGGE